MNITNVKLSLSHRSFDLDAAVPEPIRTARDLSTRVLESHFKTHSIRDALDFINSVSAHPFELQGSSLRAHFSGISSKTAGVPSPYGLKGGAARESLIQALNLRSPESPRDLDLIRKGTHHTPHDEDIARDFMPRDYDHGARVELFTELSRYLRSRDLTINEVAVFGSTIDASVLSVLDTIGQIVRPSRYGGGSLHRDPSITGRTLLKMIRLKAEGAVRGEQWALVGVPLETNYTETDLAIHLNKSFQRTKLVAELFASYCASLGLITPDTEALRYLLSELSHLSHGESSLLRDIPKEELV